MKMQSMSRVLAALLLATGSLSAIAATPKPAASKPAAQTGVVVEAEAARLAARVKEETRHAWQGYKRYAWGHDALKPLSKTGHDWYAQSLLMTPVDALDTLVLMGLDDEAREARELIAKYSK